MRLRWMRSNKLPTITLTKMSSILCKPSLANQNSNFLIAITTTSTISLSSPRLLLCQTPLWMNSPLNTTTTRSITKNSTQNLRSGRFSEVSQTWWSTTREWTKCLKDWMLAPWSTRNTAKRLTLLLYSPTTAPYQRGPATTPLWQTYSLLLSSTSQGWAFATKSSL